MTTTIALVSCVKTKLSKKTKAKDLYVSALFKAMRRYAEKSADKWFILSAKYGLVDPESLIQPYDKTLNKMLKPERDDWATIVQKQLKTQLRPKARIILLAGKRYRDGILTFLNDNEHQVDIPLKGLKMGPQLQKLNKLNK